MNAFNLRRRRAHMYVQVPEPEVEFQLGEYWTNTRWQTQALSKLIYDYETYWLKWALKHLDQLKVSQQLPYILKAVKPFVTRKSSEFINEFNFYAIKGNLRVEIVYRIQPTDNLEKLPLMVAEKYRISAKPTLFVTKLVFHDQGLQEIKVGV